MQAVNNTNTASTLQSCPACSTQSGVHRGMHYWTHLTPPNMKICKKSEAQHALATKARVPMLPAANHLVYMPHEWQAQQ